MMSPDLVFRKKSNNSVSVGRDDDCPKVMIILRFRELEMKKISHMEWREGEPS